MIARPTIAPHRPGQERTRHREIREKQHHGTDRRRPPLLIRLPGVADIDDDGLASTKSAGVSVRA
jgi:hypothetical protein